MRRIPGGRDGARPGARSPSRRLERLAHGGEGCRVEKLGSCPRSRRGGTGRRGLPAPAWTKCPGSGPEPGAFPSARRSTSPSPRSGALEGGEGASWAPYGLSRQGSSGLRGRSRPRHDPLEVSGHGCPDDAAQRVERAAAAMALDEPKAGTREFRLADVERSPRARPGRVPVIEGREERRVTAGRREQLPYAGRRASAVLRPATTAADGRGRPTSREQRRSQALWPHAHLLTTRLESWPYQRRR